ncbi:MAG TPA: hypothetical protein PLF38_05500, partial [Xylanibacter oryzae]|nr:hypothetical protein [Xylanibacter oryzae]
IEASVSADGRIGGNLQNPGRAALIRILSFFRFYYPVFEFGCKGINILLHTQKIYVRNLN